MVDNWYTYDRENRITLTQGELVDVKNAQGAVTGQQIQITARQGQQLAYDMHGNRRSATSMTSGSAVTEFYTFDDDNRLVGTYKNGLMASGRAYDGAGRMTDYITYTSTGAIDSRRENLYFDNGWMKQQNLYGGGGGLNQRTDYSAANAYDKVGNLLNYNVGVYVGTSYTNYYTYTYTKFDDYKEVKVAGSSTYFQPGETNTSYDVNGHISQVLDSQQQWVADGEYGYYAQQTTRTRSFIADADGTLLRKTDNGNVQNLYYAGDKAIGSVGGTAASPTADFDFNFTPVSDSFPAVSPGNYTVVSGDTLRGIAYKAYGDAKLWYLIADANGLMTDGDMHVGQALKIPNRITNVHNDFQTNHVYNAADIIGDITPTLPDPPPPPQASGGDGGCGGFGSILMTVVAIVATIVTQGAAAELLASAFPTYELVGSVASTIAAESAAIGAAVGNLAGQVAGNLMGVQDGINFGQIASAGLSAGLGQALSSSLLGEGGLAGVGIKDPNLQSAITYGSRAVLNQGINLLTGQQQSFDWRQVATAAISAPLANLALSGMQGNDLGSRMLQSATGDLVRQSVSSMFYAGGRLNFANIAGNAFGMAFGNADSLRSFENASQQDEKVATRGTDTSGAVDVGQALAAWASTGQSGSSVDTSDALRANPFSAGVTGEKYAFLGLQGMLDVVRGKLMNATAIDGPLAPSADRVRTEEMSRALAESDDRALSLLLRQRIIEAELTDDVAPSRRTDLHEELKALNRESKGWNNSRVVLLLQIDQDGGRLSVTEKQELALRQGIGNASAIGGMTGLNATSGLASWLRRLGRTPNEPSGPTASVDGGIGPTPDMVPPSAISTTKVSDSIIVTPRGVAITPEVLSTQGTSTLVGDFKGLQGARVDEIVSRIPSNWSVTPQEKGFGIRFTDELGAERIRLHGPSATAPAGTNSASGWTLRVHVPGTKDSYFDNLGNVVGPKANEGHIPIHGNPKAGL